MGKKNQPETVSSILMAYKMHVERQCNVEIDQCNFLYILDLLKSNNCCNTK